MSPSNKKHLSFRQLKFKAWYNLLHLTQWNAINGPSNKYSFIGLRFANLKESVGPLMLIAVVPLAYLGYSG